MNNIKILLIRLRVKDIVNFEVLKWLLVAGSTFIIDIFLFYIFSKFTFFIILTNFLAFLFSTSYNILAHKYYTFKSKNSLASVLMRYSFVLILSFSMNTTFIYYFVSFNISLIYAKFLSGIISLPINFLLLKFLVFPKQTRNYTYDFKSSSELVKFYTEKYLDLDFTGLLANRYHTWKHKLLERGLRGKSFDVVLELGTGEGQHLPFITHSYQTLLMSDIDYPQTELLFRGVENVDLVDFKLQPGRFFAQINCEKIGLPDAFADRVVLTCVLLHLNDPYTALREIRRVLKKNGQVDIYLPNTVGFLYRFLEWIFSFISTKRGNFLYRVYNLIEHKNSAYSIIQLIKFVFAKDKLNFLFFPFFFIKSWNINLFTVIRITKSETK